MIVHSDGGRNLCLLLWTKRMPEQASPLQNNNVLLRIKVELSPFQKDQSNSKQDFLPPRLGM